MPKKKVVKRKVNKVSAFEKFVRKYFIVLAIGSVTIGGVFYLSQSSKSSVLGVMTSLACQRNTPTMTISPDSANVPAATVVRYNVSITNKDSSACTSRAITLSRTNPSSSWTGGFGTSYSSTTTITIAPGYVKSLVYQLKSPPSALNTYYASVALNTLNIKKAVKYTSTERVNPTPTPKPPTPTPTRRPTPTPYR